MENKGYGKNQKMSSMEESSNFLLVCEKKKDSDTLVIVSIITKKGTDVFFQSLNLRTCIKM